MQRCLSSKASIEQIIPALHDLLQAIETTPFVTPGGAVRITMSAGVAIRAVRAALLGGRRGLYVAKRSGRNRIELSAQARDALPSGEAADHHTLAQT
jgi:PleD family two-component response regulator